MKKIIIKICLFLCMFSGISYNATDGWQAGTKAYAQANCDELQELGGEDYCPACWEYWNCDTDFSFEINPAVIIGYKPITGGGSTGGHTGGGHTGDNDNGGGPSGPGNPPEPPASVTYTVTVTASPSNGGSAGGGGDFTKGAMCTISATPNSSYAFIKWTGITASVTPYSFTVDKNYTISASFISLNDLCALKRAIAADPELASRLADYKAYIMTDTTEYGYYLRPDGTIEPQVGVGGHVSSTQSGTYTERVHTHPMELGGAPYFSAGDIRKLFTLFNGGHMADVESFRYGIVSPYGYYFLQITDSDAFRRFANNYNLSAGKKKLETEMINDIKFQGEVDVIVSSFIQFLNNQNTGLTVVRGEYANNPTNSINWQVINAAPNNTLTTINCN